MRRAVRLGLAVSTAALLLWFGSLAGTNDGTATVPGMSQREPAHARVSEREHEAFTPALRGEVRASVTRTDSERGRRLVPDWDLLAASTITALVGMVVARVWRATQRSRLGTLAAPGDPRGPPRRRVALTV